MTPELWREIERIAGDAIDLPEREQKAFVAAACDDRAELLQHVEDLLAAHRRAGEFLKAPAFGAERWTGRRIGPYRLAEEIGRGGGLDQAIRAACRRRPAERNWLRKAKADIHAGLRLCGDLADDAD